MVISCVWPKSCSEVHILERKFLSSMILNNKKELSFPIVANNVTFTICF